MIKKIRKIGNSNGFILDKALMDLLGLRVNHSVELKIRGGSLIVTPTKPGQVNTRKPRSKTTH